MDVAAGKICRPAKLLSYVVGIDLWLGKDFRHFLDESATKCMYHTNRGPNVTVRFWFYRKSGTFQSYTIGHTE